MARAMPDLVTFPAKERQRLSAGSKLYCLVTRLRSGFSITNQITFDLRLTDL